MRKLLLMNRKGLLALLLVAVVVSTTAFVKEKGEKYFEIAKQLDIFATLFKEVNTYYVDEVDPDKVIKEGISAMLESLDPYTNYIPPSKVEDFKTMTTGQYGGIGSVIGNRDGRTLILMPYKGFPAHESGLKIGDEIRKVDGVEVTDKSVSEISELLKGQANTKVDVAVKRYGHEDLLHFTLTREKITISNVPFNGMVNDHVGYIKLKDFTEGASDEVEKALKKLKGEGAQKIVLDLRGNPGGLLREAINVSNIFIPKGEEVVSTKGKIKTWNKTYKTRKSPVDEDVPVAVLVDENSASASEIVAGVMQDYDRGVLIGQRTYGKGLVQTTRPLSYNAQLKVTTAKYYIPSGRCIQAIDYSEREEDGSVGKIPDSLKTAFETSNGRTVYDGGGVKPDITMEESSPAPITQSLSSKGFIFDYATKFSYEHDSIQSPREFKLSDDEYEDFVSWLSGKEYDYTTKVEETMDELQKYAKKEKYYSKIKDELSSLEKKMSHNKKRDLKHFKGEIKEELEEQIVSRAYLRPGSIIASFDDDPELNKALDVLQDNSRYQEILHLNR